MSLSDRSAERRAVPVGDVPRCELGESPRWDASSGRLHWVDILAGLVHVLDPRSGQVHTIEIGQPVSALAPQAGGWVLGVETGVQCRDAEFRLLREFSVLPRPTRVRMNDGELDGAGRYFLGSLSYDGRPGEGRLFRFDPDGSHRVVLDGLDVSNGICWSLDGQLMYHVDSGARTIRAHAYDASTGELGRSEIFYRHPADGAVPDGITLDAEGGMWVALWDGGRIIRLDRSGSISDEVAVDAVRPTSVEFGGLALETLYITSAAIDLDARQLRSQPGNGALHRFTPDIPGLAQKSVRTSPTTRSPESTRNSAR